MQNQYEKRNSGWKTAPVGRVQKPMRVGEIPSVKTILVVEDSSINRQILKKILDSDYNVIEA